MHDEKFIAAVNVINSLPKSGPIHISVNKKLQFYSWYKIATHGNNDTPKPSRWNVIGTLKWNAWTKANNMNPEDAKENYVREMGEILKSVYLSGKSEEYLKNADMSFIKKLSKKDIDILSEEVNKDTNTDESMKKIFFELHSKYVE